MKAHAAWGVSPPPSPGSGSPPILLMACRALRAHAAVQGDPPLPLSSVCTRWVRAACPPPPPARTLAVRNAGDEGHPLPVLSCSGVPPRVPAARFGCTLLGCPPPFSPLAAARVKRAIVWGISSPRSLLYRFLMRGARTRGFCPPPPPSPYPPGLSRPHGLPRCWRILRWLDPPPSPPTPVSCTRDVQARCAQTWRRQNQQIYAAGPRAAGFLCRLHRVGRFCRPLSTPRLAVASVGSLHPGCSGGWWVFVSSPPTLSVLPRSTMIPYGPS